MHPVDSHTLHELQILSEGNGSASILQFFDQTKTPGGRDLLKQMLRAPKTSISEIKSFQVLLQTIALNLDSWEVKISRS